MATRTTNAEVERRVTILYALVLQAEARNRILDFAVQKWSISLSQAKNYYAKAQERLTDDLRAERVELLAIAIAQRNDLYRQAYKAKKWFTCLQVADSRDKLLGLEYRLEDHVKAAIAAGYIVMEPGAPAEAEGTTTDQSAERFFGIDDSDRAITPDSIDSIQQQ